MKPFITALLLPLILMICAACRSAYSPSDPLMFDLQNNRESRLSALLPVLARHQIILIGEEHLQPEHHKAQLEIIKALHSYGKPVAIGLEMFRMDSQKKLERWVKGNISETDFRKIYYDNWNFPWELYRGIFDYAKMQQIPLIGLNSPRGISSQVAREGFQSLTKEQKGKLPDLTCDVDQEYRDFIQKAFGVHAHDKLNFTYFCEAQLVWDTTMAINSLDYLKSHPDHTVIILTGRGHARKGGIPKQIETRSRYSLAVILPEIKGETEAERMTIKDTDYILRME